MIQMHYVRTKIKNYLLKFHKLFLLIFIKVNFIGRDEFQLLIDVGEPIDSNAIEALCYEVLEEKIKSMINKNFESQENQHDMESNAKNRTTPPVPSPRKSVEHADEEEDERSIPTPQRTPSPSLQIQPQNDKKFTSKSTETENLNQIKQTKEYKEIDLYKIFEMIQKVKANHEREEQQDQDNQNSSLLDLTLRNEESDNDMNDLSNERQALSVVVPPTPKETPPQSPVLIEPKIRQEPKNFR
jgi:hypothetical protein